MHDPERRDLSNEELTHAVLASFAGAGDDRFREIAESLVRHLHAFVDRGRARPRRNGSRPDFLTRTGQISDDKRQEFILLSDVLGLSMLVIGRRAVGGGATEATVFGPFFVEGRRAIDERRRPRARARPGQPCFMQGHSSTGR